MNESFNTEECQKRGEIECVHMVPFSRDHKEINTHVFKADIVEHRHDYKVMVKGHCHY